MTQPIWSLQEGRSWYVQIVWLFKPGSSWNSCLCFLLCCIFLLVYVANICCVIVMLYCPIIHKHYQFVCSYSQTVVFDKYDIGILMWYSTDILHWWHKRSNWNSVTETYLPLWHSEIFTCYQDCCLSGNKNNLCR